MAFTPIVQVDDSSPSESAALDQRNFNDLFSAMVDSIESINRSLKLLNLRLEEAFETGIFEDDVG